MFFYFYYVIVTITYIVFLPFLFLLSFKQKYKRSIPARFFCIKNPPFRGGKIHFHICSFGEAKSIEPIVKQFLPKEVNCTAITQTGFDALKRFCKSVRFLPFEIFLPFWVRRQRVLIVSEAELCYALFRTYKKRGTKTILINARISDKSLKRYMLFKWFYKYIFANIDVVFAQSKEDAKRLQMLGAKNIKVSGNIKLANLPKVNKKYKIDASLVVCAASTHPKEEELIIKAFLKLKEREPKASFILAPRHPERFNEVRKLMQHIALKNNLEFLSLSENGKKLEADLILDDKLGELVNLYAISDIVVLGGAFRKIGGHNAAEAAQFGCKIISGEHFFNQKDIFRAIDGIVIVKEKELTNTLLNYKALPNTKIKTKSSLEPIIKEIKSVL